MPAAKPHSLSDNYNVEKMKLFSSAVRENGSVLPNALFATAENIFRVKRIKPIFEAEIAYENVEIAEMKREMESMGDFSINVYSLGFLYRSNFYELHK